MEALLLVASKKRIDWSVGELSEELRSEHSLITELLIDLQRAGLIVVRNSKQEARFHYAPTSELLRQRVEALATLYRERRYSVLALIYETRVE